MNLALAKSCTVTPVRNCIGIINKVYAFLNTHKRYAVLKLHIDLLIPDTSKQRLVRMCETRWVEKHNAITAFVAIHKHKCLNLNEI